MAHPFPAPNAQPVPSASGGMFYEIEYDSCPFPGVGRFVLKPQPQKINEPQKDERRELFGRMRDIARAQRSAYDFSRFFDRRVQNENAVIFHKQGLFMKDFTDDYTGNIRYSQYFPSYQMMGYEQLRTYFTWRAQVRKGNVSDTSPSYAFVYIYELLGNIGAADPLDGLNKLMSFWNAFREYFRAIDKYVLHWLKDYHVYYELPHTFKEFVEKNGLVEHYPKLIGTDDDFDLFCSVSKYDIRKSAFFTDETSKITTDCFSFVMDRIRREFESAGMNFDGALFRPTRKIAAWKPFKDALFYPWTKQPDRRIVLCENEIYMCRKNEWMFSTIITSEKGSQFIGYVMKQMESVLRKATKHKYKLTANTDMINRDTNRVLTKAGLSIEKIVTAAVTEYYREATKTVVTVDRDALARIRREALATQESLIVEEQPQQKATAPTQALFTVQDKDIFADSAEEEPAPVESVWDSLKDALGEEEARALALIFRGCDIKAFADERGIMIEVLVDGINEKAMDCIGDNLMDEDFVLYEDYRGQIKAILEQNGWRE